MKNKVVIISNDWAEFGPKVKALNLADLEIVVPINDEERVREVKDANIIYGNPFVFKKFLDHAPKLVWVQSTFAGVDALCSPEMRQDYMLTNVKDAYGPHMSEYVFAYILMMEKGVLKNLEKQKRSHWEQEGQPTIQGKTLVILGTGSIGKVIAKNAKSFGMRVLGYKTSDTPVEYFDEIYTQDDKKECFKQADYLVSVLPNTPETKHTVNAESLSWMKRSSIFINVGRGLNVDEEALLNALENKQIAGAVLDVFQTEPLPEDHPFWIMDNVFVTPHISGYTKGADRLIEIFANNYKKFHAGEELDYLIDFERGF